MQLIGYATGDPAAERWTKNTGRIPRFLHTLAELWHQTDEVPLTDQTRGQRKAIKERRKAREKAQKHQNRKSDAVAVEAHSQYAPLSNFLHTEPVAEELCHLGHVGAVGGYR